ncbi:hypothetical protein C3941_04805 [Kaistia algarum]|jgi:hypothetical protein|uniref:hypothetical protein n=1 Tax=Kaistia algarum TaxID=2083279 RepID=UPI000CE79018|nr:hypothetical protein [Kaistia algarum]MCX5516000.1 hypothetical protein [Kaistia algarum]PPE80646.1 hypothetical protein C3941_04805 [Kaistia algarum]
MNVVLLFLHFVGLVMGFAGGIGSAVTMRFASGASAEGAAALKRLPPAFAKISAYGLVILWITGLILIWSVYGGPQNLPGLFWLKIVFVLILTGLNGWHHAIYAQIRRTGDPSRGERLKIIGPASGLSALLAMAVAVIVFN